MPPVMAAAPANSSGADVPVRGSGAVSVAPFAFVESVPVGAPGGTYNGSGGDFATLFNPHATLANDARVGTLGSSLRALLKSSTSARFRAFASRCVNGASPQRHSIIFSTEVCSYGPSETTFAGDQGDATMHGTRKPSCW